MYGAFAEIKSVAPPEADKEKTIIAVDNLKKTVQSSGVVLKLNKKLKEK